MSRHPHNCLALTLLLFALTFPAPTASADPELIYDNLVTPKPTVASIVGERGDQVLLGGTNRDVVRVDLPILTTSGSGEADFVLRLYANDGPGGAPESLLYATPSVHLAYSVGQSLVHSFAIPSITVPDEFTWTIEGSPFTGAAPLIRWYHPPAIGSSGNFTWSRNIDGNFVINEVFGETNVDNFGARIYAVPEPATLLLMLMAGVGTAHRRRLKCTLS